MWLEQQHLGWKVGMSEIEAKLSNPLLLCLLLPLATTDAVRLGEVEREPAVLYTPALHYIMMRKGREKGKVSKQSEGV